MLQQADAEMAETRARRKHLQLAWDETGRNGRRGPWPTGSTEHIGGRGGMLERIPCALRLRR